MVRAAAIARFAAKYTGRIIEARTVAAANDAAAAAKSGGIITVGAAGDAADAALNAALAAAAASDAAAADVAAIHAAYAVADAATAAAAASSAAAAVATSTATATAVEQDIHRLHNKAMTAVQLAASPLWSDLPPPRIGGAWQGLAQALRASGDHWSVWIDWYDDVLAGAPHALTSEAEDAAFTDIPGKLPWDQGAQVVNREIMRRLQELRESGTIESSIPEPKLDAEAQKARTLTQLVEVASPQPSINKSDQLDAGPNQPFDVPNFHDDLSTLPLRQRNLIGGILRDLPANAPKHLKDFLRSYDEELIARGAQPILGLLQDDADIVAAAVTAPRAEDEWLEPRMRKAFERFAENHEQFVKHFPLDAEREALYSNTPVNEAKATGQKFIETFERVAEAARDAHLAGKTTDDFMMVIDKMTEFARVVSTQPPASLLDKQHSALFPEIIISPDERIEPVTAKKRVILGSLGFYERTYNLVGSTVTIAGYAGIVEALKPAIEMLLRLLH